MYQTQHSLSIAADPASLLNWLTVSHADVQDTHEIVVALAGGSDASHRAGQCDELD